MECNDTPHGSELGPHSVLGPKKSKFGPMGPKKITQKFLYTKLFSRGGHTDMRKNTNFFGCQTVGLLSRS